MDEAFPPASPVAPGAQPAPETMTEPLTRWRMPLWQALVLAAGSALLAAWGTQAWMQREPSAENPPQAWLLDDSSPIDVPPPAAGVVEQVHPPKMLYGMLPLHSGHGLRDEQCRQLATEALKDAGVTDIDAGGESALFARQGDYALFVGCHLDQKLILVGAAGPVPEQAESLQEQLLSSLQTRF